MVVAVEYISKEESTDVAEGAASAQHGVTGILAVQGAFAEHAAMLDRLGAPWKLLRAAEDFDDSIDRVILPGGESTTQGKLLRSTGLFEPISAHIAAGKPVFGTCAGMICSLVVSITTRTSILVRWTLSCAAMRTAVSWVRSLRPPISALLTMRMLWWLRRGSLSLPRFPRLLVRRGFRGFGYVGGAQGFPSGVHSRTVRCRGWRAGHGRNVGRRQCGRFASGQDSRYGVPPRTDRRYPHSRAVPQFVGSSRGAESVSSPYVLFWEVCDSQTSLLYVLYMFSLVR